MIDPQTIQKILDTADIVDVVSDFVSLRRRGVNYIGLCPFHDEKTGSFTVSPSKGICKCFGCGKGGSPVNFIMEHEQLSYPDALRYLAKKYNIPIEERELSEKEKANKSERESLFAANEWAKSYFTSTLKNTEEGRNIALSYFRERGINDASIEKFSLGYSLDDFTSMTKAAREKGYKDIYLEKTGLCGKTSKGELYDRFKGRIIFPVQTLSGKTVAFGGRIMKKNDKSAKYVNSPESEIYHKSNELYGIFHSKSGIVKEDKCYLVEGYTDVISMHQSGITNVVASSGTALTHGQIRMIHRLTPNITMLYDGDSAGIKASMRGIDLLLEQGMNVRVVSLPEGEDPDSYAQSHNSADFIHFIEENETDFIHFKIKLLLDESGNDPIKRAKVIQDITQSVAIIPDQIIRSVYIKETARLLDIPESVIIDETNKLRNKAKADEAKKQGFTLKTSSNTQRHQPSYRNEIQNNSQGRKYGNNPQDINNKEVDLRGTSFESERASTKRDIKNEESHIRDISLVPPPEMEHYPNFNSPNLPPTELSGDEADHTRLDNVPPPTEEYFGGENYPERELSQTEFYDLYYSDTTEDNNSATNSPNYAITAPLFYENEKELINYVVRHGHEVMIVGVEGESDLTVGEYILIELEELKATNGSYLYNPLYNEMINILKENIDKDNFMAFRCYVNYPDPQISMEAAELLSDKYQLSKIFTINDEFIGDINNNKEVEEHKHRMENKHISELYHAVTKVVLTYKYKIIIEMQSNIRHELKQAELSNNTELLFSTLRKLTEINQTVNRLAPLVGQRVVNG